MVLVPTLVIASADALEMMPPIVKSPEPPIELAAPKAIAPLSVAAVPALLIKAPLPPTPTPFSVIGLYKVKPLRSKVAPLLTTFDATVIFVPKAPLVIEDTLPVELTPNFKVPAVMVVPLV